MISDSQNRQAFCSAEDFASVAGKASVCFVNVCVANTGFGNVPGYQVYLSTFLVAHLIWEMACCSVKANDHIYSGYSQSRRVQPVSSRVQHT